MGTVVSNLSIGYHLQQTEYAPIRAWVEYDLRRSIKQIKQFCISSEIIDITDYTLNPDYVTKRQGAISVLLQFEDKECFSEDLKELQTRYNAILFKRAMRKRVKELREIKNEHAR